MFPNERTRNREILFCCFHWVYTWWKYGHWFPALFYFKGGTGDERLWFKLKRKYIGCGKIHKYRTREWTDLYTGIEYSGYFCEYCEFCGVYNEKFELKF